MKKIICINKDHGRHDFFLVEDGTKYFLFSQSYKAICEEYFGKGININDALNKSKSSCKMLKTTKEKLFKAIEKFEKEEGIFILKKSEGYTSNTGINKKMYLNYIRANEQYSA